MKVIKVFSPFHLTAGGKKRAFFKGIHQVGEDELNHKFMRAMIALGKARECEENLFPPKASQVTADAGAGEEGRVPARSEYEALGMDALKEIAGDCGIVFPANISKIKLVDKIMARHEECRADTAADGKGE